MPPRPSDQADELSELLDALSHPHRRRVLARLEAGTSGETGPIDLETLSEVEGLDDEIGLIHNHLPKLADSGFVVWDRQRNVVTRGPRFDEIEPLVGLMATHEDELPESWP